MFVSAINTRGSRLAAAAVALLLLLSVPIVTVVQDAITQSSLMLILAVLIGAALGWIAGDTIVQSRPGGRFALAILVLAIIVLGLFFPFSAIAQIESFGRLRLYISDIFALPLPDRSAMAAVRYATAAFALATIVALLFSPRATLLDAEPLAKGTAWTAIASLATALTLLLGVHTFVISQVRWQQEVTIRAIAEENADKPYASRHCLEAILKLDKAQLDKLYIRDKVELRADQGEYILRCFADHDGSDQDKLYIKGGSGAAEPRLTAKGAALLAQRVNYTLTKDGLVASLLRYNIGDRALVTSELKGRLCGLDRILVKSMNETPLGDPPRLLYDENDSLYWLVVISDFCPAGTGDARPPR